MLSNKNYIVAIILSVLGNLAIGQQEVPNDSLKQYCIDKVKEYTARVYLSEPPKGKDAFRTKYRVEKSYWDSLVYNPTREEIELVLSSKQMHYKTPSVQLFQDDKDAIVVSKLDKTVIWMPSAMDVLSEETRNDRKSAISEFFKLSDQFSFDIVDDADGICKVAFYFSNALEGELDYHTVEYVYNFKQDKMLSSTIYYTPYSQMKKETITVLSEDFDARLDVKGSVFRQVFDRNGDPYSKFKNYRFIDAKNE